MIPKILYINIKNLLIKNFSIRRLFENTSGPYAPINEKTNKNILKVFFFSNGFPVCLKKAKCTDSLNNCIDIYATNNT